MTPSRIFTFALSSSLLLACGDLPEPGTKVDSLRVLAESVDQPIARPGETVQLSSLWHDPEGRTVTWAWASCVNPQSSDLAGCLARIAEQPDPEAAIFALGPDESAPTLSIPDDVISSLPAAARANAQVGVISVACPAELSFGQGPGGLPFVCREGDGRQLELHEFIVGLKRVRVRETDRNQNPIIEGITFDGEDWPEDEVKSVGSCDTSEFVYLDCADDHKHQLGVKLAEGVVERGTDEHGNRFEEQVVVQYYATEGIFEHEVKIAAQTKNGYVARKRASGRELTLWFVARDDRGGVAWTERRVQVR